ncbi:TPA: hemagglutinin repeat-containing protein, partial [Yersinia enterocolitica]|nr:hemagglutinin repeat-containing protein [Yersinia enterocolitica]
VVHGSQLQAGKDASLTASRDVILQSTQETQTLDGSNKSSGGSLGIGIGAGQGGWGINISASLNKGKGSESGNGLTHTETTVNAGNQLNITSGRDTVLHGAQVSGETVKADVGRDLLLQSQQDSDRYDSKQQDASVGGSFNFGSMTGSASINASRDKMHSNFDSVQEQTGFFAGKGGFDITVGEHTQLDGVVIASTATADKNTLDTGTLGFSNIGNKADFKVEHQSVGISTGGNIGGQFVGNMANGLLVGSNNEGHDNSTTHAAVSDGTITIRDTDKQQQNVADLSRDVEHANNALSPIFDKEKEQNRLREAQLIGEIGSQVSDVIRTQGKIIATKAANEKMLDVSEKDKVDAKAQWEKANPGQVATAEDINGQVYKTAYDQAFNESGYGTGGKFQQAAQAATAAIQGLAGGDMSKALAGASAPYLAEVIHNMTTDPVTGKVNTEANLMAHAVLGAVMAQINGNNALSGASGALMGEFIAQQLYPDIPRNELSEEQKQTISALGTLAAGLAGGLTGNSTADAVAGAQAGKNALENNNLAILRTGAAACAEITVCSKAVIDLGFGALIGVGVATSAIEDLSGPQKTNVMLAAMSGDQEQIDKLSPSERAAYEELKNGKGLITGFPTPVDDPTGGKLVNPAP